MSAIKHALLKLEHAISSLDNSVEYLEQSLAGEQRDMFALPMAKNGSASNGHALDGALVTQKIDNAIKRVESILNDG